MKGETIMAKWFKRLCGLAAVGGAAAAVFYYLKNKDMADTDDFEDEFEDEDFDLDNDLKSPTDREYVPLNTAPKAELDSEETETADTEEAAPEEPEEKAEETE